jgi:hypothetical protein
MAYGNKGRTAAQRVAPNKPTFKAGKYLYPPFAVNALVTHTSEEHENVHARDFAHRCDSVIQHTDSRETYPD